MMMQLSGPRSGRLQFMSQSHSEYEDARSKIASFREQQQQKIAEITKMKEELTEQTQHKESVKTKLQQYKGELTKLRCICDERDKVVQRLKQQVDSIKNRFEAVHVAFNENVSKRMAGESELKTMEEQLESKHDEFRVIQEQTERILSRKKESQAILARDHEQLLAFSSRLRSLMSLAEEKKSKIHALTESLDQDRRSLTERNKGYADRSETNRLVIESRNKLKVEVDSSDDKRKTLINRISALRDQNRKMDDHLQSLQQHERRVNEAIHRKEETLGLNKIKRQELGALHASNAHAKTKLDKEKDRRVQLSQMTKASTTDISTMKAQQQQLQSKIDQAQRDLEKEGITPEVCGQHLRWLTEHRNALPSDEKVGELKNEIDFLSDSTDVWNTLRQKRQELAACQQRECENVKEKINVSVALKMNEEKETQQAEEQIAKETDAAAQLARDVEQAQKKKDEMEKTVTQANEELSVTEAKLKETTSSLQEAESQLKRDENKFIAIKMGEQEDYSKSKAQLEIEFKKKLQLLSSLSMGKSYEGSDKEIIDFNAHLQDMRNANLSKIRATEERIRELETKIGLKKQDEEAKKKQAEEEATRQRQTAAEKAAADKTMAEKAAAEKATAAAAVAEQERQRQAAAVEQENKKREQEEQKRIEAEQKAKQIEDKKASLKVQYQTEQHATKESIPAVQPPPLPKPDESVIKPVAIAMTSSAVNESSASAQLEQAPMSPPPSPPHMPIEDVETASQPTPQKQQAMSTLSATLSALPRSKRRTRSQLKEEQERARQLMDVPWSEQTKLYRSPSRTKKEASLQSQPSSIAAERTDKDKKSKDHEARKQKTEVKRQKSKEDEEVQDVDTTSKVDASEAEDLENVADPYADVGGVHESDAFEYVPEEEMKSEEEHVKAKKKAAAKTTKKQPAKTERAKGKSAAQAKKASQKKQTESKAAPVKGGEQHDKRKGGTKSSQTKTKDSKPSQAPSTKRTASRPPSKPASSNVNQGNRKKTESVPSSSKTSVPSSPSSALRSSMRSRYIQSVRTWQVTTSTSNSSSSGSSMHDEDLFSFTPEASAVSMEESAGGHTAESLLEDFNLYFSPSTATQANRASTTFPSSSPSRKQASYVPQDQEPNDLQRALSNDIRSKRKRKMSPPAPTKSTAQKTSGMKRANLSRKPSTDSVRSERDLFNDDL